MVGTLRFAHPSQLRARMRCCARVFSRPRLCGAGAHGIEAMLPHLLVGVVGGFQPDLLARSLAGDSDGIYSRFLCAWPPEAPFREPADDADETDPEIINAFGRLANLQAGDDEAFAPRSVPLAADAISGHSRYQSASLKGA